MKNGKLLMVPIFAALLLVSGCNSIATDKIDSKSTTATSNTKENVAKLVTSNVSDANSSEITVKATVQNSTDKAVPLQPSDLALIVNSSAVLSPSAKSQIPSQIPATSTVQLSLVFDNQGQVKDGASVKVGYQPDSAHPEQFVALDKIAIKDTTPVDESATKHETKPSSDGEGAAAVVFVQSDGSKVEIPLVRIAATYGVTMSQTPPNTKIPEIAFEIPKDETADMGAFWMHKVSGRDTLILGPKGWIPTKAGVDQYGTEQIVLQSPADYTQTLTYKNDGGCVECSILDIGAYFPDEKDWVMNTDKSIGGYWVPKFVFDKKVDSNTVAYQVDNGMNGYETIGAAHANISDKLTDIKFDREEITVESSQDKTAATMILFYAKMMKEF